jgi:hypothetical protein
MGRRRRLAGGEAQGTKIGEALAAISLIEQQGPMQEVPARGVRRSQRAGG